MMSNKFKVGLSILATLAIISCGGGGSSSNKKGSDNNSDKTNPNKSEQTFVINKTFDNPKYEPKSANTQLGSAYVNKYDKIQTALLSQKANQKDFNLTVDTYVEELLYVHKPMDNIPSYAPRGELRSKVFDVKSGGIDYSSYILEGDFNDDGLIDFKDIDLLKEALYKNANSSTFGGKYDLDSDGKLDTKDLITLTSRLLTNVSYFDFYDTKGKKLNIPTKKYSDPKNVSYSGSETKIMVVAKDMNKASSYADTLSDIGDVWYKQNTTKSRGYFNDKQEFGDTQAAINYINKNLQKYVDISPSFVTGFRYKAKLFSSIDGMDFIDFSTSSGTIENIAKDIENHFPTKLGFKYKKRISPKQVILHIGNLQDKKHTGVNALRAKLKTSTKVGNKTITKLVFLHVASVTYYSNSEVIKADVKDTSDKEAKGTLTLKRFGPLPKEKTFTKEGEGKFEFPNASFGGYRFEFENECRCKLPLNPPKKDIVHDQDKDLNLQITQMQKPISIRLVYKDKKGKPIKNKKVEISETNRCRDKDHKMKSDTKTTDDDGVVNFPSGFTSGEFTIDGKKYNFCENTNKNMNTRKLWDIEYNYENGLFSVHENVENVEIFDKDDRPYQTLADFQATGKHTAPLHIPPSRYLIVGGANGSQYDMDVQYTLSAIEDSGDGWSSKSNIYCLDFIDIENKIRSLAEPTIYADPGIRCGTNKTGPHNQYDGIDTTFTSSETAKFLNHEDFTVARSGKGAVVLTRDDDSATIFDASLTVKFTAK